MTTSNLHRGQRLGDVHTWAASVNPLDRGQGTPDAQRYSAAVSTCIHERTPA